jgi:hypothetical protein
MDILEFMKPDRRFTPSEVIEDKITHLISELYQYKLLIDLTDGEKEVVESWRNQLVLIRGAVGDALDADLCSEKLKSK